MPEQYVASDKRTGLEVTLSGDFPPHQTDRIRIARTTNLFTRLISTILATPEDSLRRERFSAVETQLEIADALIRQDMDEVGQLLRTTMEKMGITHDQLEEIARQVIERLGPDAAQGLGPLWPPPDDPSPPEDGSPEGDDHPQPV
ncbi:MAG: hypothetical protein WEC33_04235 [Dehalococcoidia bacterium]